MIYFLVNNNYHFLDVLIHLEELQDEKKVLIQIPHTLDVINQSEDFSEIYTFHTPFLGAKSLLNIPKIKAVERQIDKIDFKEKDILFVYTEYEILNQYIMHKCKAKNAKVYVIEDGGFPTYLTYSVENDAPLPFKGKIKLWFFKHILGYDFLQYLYFNHIMFPQIKSNYIDGVLVYLDVDIKRDIPKYLITKPIKTINLDETKALYLNEKLYNYYCSKEEYKAILLDCLTKIQQKFSKVYFKFHPSETEENRQWQLAIINQISNIHIIEENAPIEKLIETYNAKYVFSFLSAALLNLNAWGVTPVYLYHLYPELSRNSVFKQIDYILKNAHYSFWEEESSINTIGFTQTKQSNLSLKVFIDNMRQNTSIGWK